MQFNTTKGAFRSGRLLSFVFVSLVTIPPLINGFEMSQTGLGGRAWCAHGACESSTGKLRPTGAFLSVKELSEKTNTSHSRFVFDGSVLALALVLMFLVWKVLQYFDLCFAVKGKEIEFEMNQHEPEHSESPSGPSSGRSPTSGGKLAQLHDALARDQSVADLICAQCISQPEKEAILRADGSASLTYRKLWQNVLALSRAMSDAGLVEGDVVAFLLGPSCALTVAALGSIHAGLIWAPLDSASPMVWRRGQLSRMEAQLQLAAATSEQQEVVHCDIVPIWVLGEFGELSHSVPRPVRPTGLRSHSCAPSGTTFIIHTSGSTGKPKGVCYSRDTLLHGVLTFSDLCNMDSSSVALLKTPATWAVVEYELFPALVSGGSIVADSQCQKDLKHLAQVLEQRSVTTLVTSAGVLRGLVEDFWNLSYNRPASLRHVVNIGAGIPINLCAAVNKAIGDRVHVTNCYGCTETPLCIWTYLPTIEAGKTSSVAPAGRPQPDVDVYLLDSNFQQVPPGDDGEVCFCGHFLASGYLNDQTTTKERFLPHPFGEGQMYRTGDLGRWALDPADPSKLVLHLVGRMDRQTNIRGLRVSPEDVEAVIKESAGVKEAAVVLASAKEQEQCLVAFVESTICSDAVDLEQSVKYHCSESLPQHMHPAFISCHKDLPKLANGKVDLRLLEQKASALIESEPLVADSLGVMRKGGKDAMQQEGALSSSRGIAMMAIMVYHLVAMDNLLQGHSWAAKLFFDAMLFLNWSMFLFAIQSALQDRTTDENNISGQWRGTLLIFFLLLATNGPVQWTLNVICRALSSHPDHVNVRVQMPIRWYLSFYLLCRCLSVYVLSPCERRLRKCKNQAVGTAGPIIMTLFVIALAWLGDIDVGQQQKVFMVPNMCPGFAQNSRVVYVMSWFFAHVNASFSEDPAHCPLVPHQLFLWCLAAYVAAWWYAKDIIKQVGKRWLWLAAMGPMPTATVFVAVAMMYFQLKYLVPAVISFLVDVLMCILLACILMLSCALADQTSWLNRALAFTGRFSLGTYVFHLYFLGYYGVFSWQGLGTNAFVPYLSVLLSHLDFAGRWKTIPQLILMVAYYFSFVVIIGAPLQILVADSFNRAINAVCWLIEEGRHCFRRLENRG